jgi:hypothetical protein
MIVVEGRQCIVPGTVCGELTRIKRAVVGVRRVTRGSSLSPGEMEWWRGSGKVGGDLAAKSGGNGSAARIVWMGNEANGLETRRQ